jgi:molecular chaperone DnaJ
VAENRGQFSFSRTCPRCFGRGKIISDPCPDCRGEGERVIDKTFRIRIKPDTADGTTLRLRGQGAPGEGGMPPGDLIVEIRVPENAFLRREGLDVVCTIELTSEQMQKGARVKVKTREGRKAIVTVPPGTAGGTRLRLPGLGYAMDGKRGDQIVEVHEVEPTPA